MDNFPIQVEDLLKSIIRNGGFALDYAVRKAEPPESGTPEAEWLVEFSGPDSDLLLERNGALLDALEHLLLKVVHGQETAAGKIEFDCQEWRRLRAEELRAMARLAAERVQETGEPFELSPMNPRERRIVHLVLRDDPHVQTVSEGSGTDRKVVITPHTQSSNR
jgi:spoIIIJ-associated protein